MVSNVLFLAALCTEVVSGLAFEAARATQYTEDREGLAPTPTAAPWSPYELLKRQSSITTDLIFAETYLQADDNTCGYLSGTSGFALTCAGTATCDLWPARATATAGAVACCLGSDCTHLRGCVASADYSGCDTKCDSNSKILKCTGSAAPFCNTAVWNDVNVRHYYCSSRQISSVQIFDTTFTGQSFGGIFTVRGDTDTSPATTPTSTTSRRFITSASPLSPSDSDSSTSSRRSTTFAGLDPVESDSPPNIISIDDRIISPPKKTSMGPIIGGVVGGLAVIAALVAFFLRKRRAKKYAAAAAVPVFTDSHGQAPPPVYNQSFAPPPPLTSEMDGAGKPPPMASVSEHGYFAPAPTPKPHGESQYAQDPNGVLSSNGGDTRRTSAVSPISPPAQHAFVAGQSPLPPGASESYVTPAGQAQYPSYPPPGAHDMPPAAHEMPGMPPTAAHEMPGNEARRY